jgi:hypothetical protein
LVASCCSCWLDVAPDGGRDGVAEGGLLGRAVNDEERSAIMKAYRRQEMRVEFSLQRSQSGEKSGPLSKTLVLLRLSGWGRSEESNPFAGSRSLSPIDSRVH